ncbi:excinuclease ABC subunit B [Flavobacterium sp. MAH-1]|uniref:Excinuclease ABC subunit B n=1 Tax=Flavobacterium agri TaxID=2743471 RepID=A0A7Y9C7I7_9FLAO|nr:excinuclease ABC subunit B [Flavobacterium agri]NUY82400.1 excinuclease ABC subunit B [Flavobacterium agri]NYA72424.1 excinuclease ABC subunit B [Flavobacterium agri]
MHNYEEKLSLLLDMIQFSVVDGKLDPREYQLLALIASELKIDKQAFDDLFHQEPKPHVIKSEMQRIHQFYRLALLMHIDGEVHEREQSAINQIAIEMGLNPTATKRILGLMKESEYKILDPNLVFSIFKEQQN